MKDSNIDKLVSEILACKTKKELVSWLDDFDGRFEKDSLITDPNEWVVLANAFVEWERRDK